MTSDIPPVLVPDWPAPLTKQQVFDRAYQWAATHERCVNADQCLYRSPDNTNACLIGACIPDSVYEEIGRPANAVSFLLDSHPEVRALFAADVTEPFLKALQKVHDRFEHPSAVEPKPHDVDVNAWDTYNAMLDEVYPEVKLPNLRAFAAEWGLTVPEVVS